MRRPVLAALGRGWEVVEGKNGILILMMGRMRRMGLMA